MSHSQEPKGTAKTLGEHRIIQIIQDHLTPMPNMPVPFGDDVSGVNIGNTVALLKTDMLVAETDVPKGMSIWQAARKAIVMNVSDFASKGGKPTVALVALGLPCDFSQVDIEEIAEGLNTGAQQYGVHIIGGDTSQTSDLIISVSMFGTVKKSALMLRSGSKVGDILAVTGFFGKPSAGLSLLLGQYSVEEERRKILSESVLMPRAKLEEGLALGNSGMVSASIDSSDGLAWSLHELGRLSNVSFALNLVPVAPEVQEFAEQNGLDASELALYGGEEYELVLTVKPEGWNATVAAVEAVGGHLISIGKATKKCDLTMEINGEKRQIEARGWEHFKSQP